MIRWLLSQACFSVEYFVDFSRDRGAPRKCHCEAALAKQYPGWTGGMRLHFAKSRAWIRKHHLNWLFLNALY